MKNLLYSKLSSEWVWNVEFVDVGVCSGVGVLLLNKEGV